METILIATDFSSAAQKALQYGVQLANIFKSRVILLHVYAPVLSATDMVALLTPAELKERTEQRLNDEVALLTQKGSVAVEIRAEEGLPSETIERVAKQVKAKWIIAGMKGGGKTIRRIFGSVALTLSHHSNVPLIVVPEEAVFKTPKTIALASDISDETDVHVVDPLEEFGVKCGTRMYVVRVIKKRMDDLVERLLRPSRVRWHCKELHPTFEFLNDNDVTHAITEFVKKHGVDMVAMIAGKHNIFERMFAKSNIKEMLLHTHIPLIILPHKVAISNHNKVDESAEMGHS